MKVISSPDVTTFGGEVGLLWDFEAEPVDTFQQLRDDAIMPYQLYVNGQWTDAAGGGTLDVLNPATGEAVASCAYGDVADATAAIEAAAAAFADWRAMTAYERAGFLHKAAELVRQRVPDIARALTLENGKPLAEATGEAGGCAGWLDWFAEEGKRVYGRMIPSQFDHKRHWVLRQPVGVVVAVNAWNFPINLMSRKLGAALAAGCSLVCRPATQAPLSAMLIYECLHDAGFPPGSVGLVTGPADKIVPAMLAHRACRKLA